MKYEDGGSKKLPIVKTDADYAQLVPQENTPSGDMFGLEQYRDTIGGREEAGKQAFSEAARKIVEYARTNKAAAEQFSDADSVMELPYIVGERLTGRLTLITEKNEIGAAIATISLTTGDTRTTRHPAGFHMTQGPDGRVAIIHADLESERTWQPSTQGYDEAIAAVNKYIGVYFETLATMKTSEELRRAIGEKANTLYETREAVGIRTTNVFGKTITTKRSDRSAKKILGLIAGDSDKRR